MRLLFVLLTLTCSGVLSTQRYVPGYLLTEDVAAYSRCRGEVPTIYQRKREAFRVWVNAGVDYGRLKPIVTDANFGPEAGLGIVLGDRYRLMARHQFSRNISPGFRSSRMPYRATYLMVSYGFH